jgi:hypothetical protein
MLLVVREERKLLSSEKSIAPLYKDRKHSVLLLLPTNRQGPGNIRALGEAPVSETVLKEFQMAKVKNE